MFGEEKNLKDSTANRGVIIKDKAQLFISYMKTDKLITALYMVTDIIDKDEPLRNKLRTLGTGIISDMHMTKQSCDGHVLSLIFGKISEIMSFLDIASAVNIVSAMNCAILRKEFSELEESVKEATTKAGIVNRDLKINLSEFLADASPLEGWSDTGRAGMDTCTPPLSDSRSKYSPRGELNSLGHSVSTRLGIQKGGTLMQALSDRKLVASMSNKNVKDSNPDTFDILKKQRRDEITNILRLMGGNATIKDIKDKVQAMSASRLGEDQIKSLVSTSEKTLQRELVSMVKDGVLNKTGEKRWSRYFLTKRTF